MNRRRTDGQSPGGALTRAAAFALLLVIASVVPLPGRGSETGGAGIDLPLGIGLTDPFHLVGYAVLALLLAGATDRRGEQRRRLGRGEQRGRRLGIVVAVLVAVAVGFGIELVQSTVPWRSFAWRDVAINAAGAAIGGGVASVTRRVRGGDRRERDEDRRSDPSRRRR